MRGVDESSINWMYWYVQGTTLMRSPEWEVFTCMRVATSAETILTLKNRELIHFAKFAHDTCADTFF